MQLLETVFHLRVWNRGLRRRRGFRRERLASKLGDEARQVEGGLSIRGWLVGIMNARRLNQLTEQRRALGPQGVIQLVELILLAPGAIDLHLKLGHLSAQVDLPLRGGAQLVFQSVDFCWPACDGAVELLRPSLEIDNLFQRAV